MLTTILLVAALLIGAVVGLWLGAMLSRDERRAAEAAAASCT